MLHALQHPRTQASRSLAPTHICTRATCTPLLPPCPAAAPGKPAGLASRVVASMQAWMMRLIQQHGFLGILLLASWPNTAFDLCGICCGAFLMPFWEFFGATLIGKGVIKVTGQTLFFVSLFRWAGLGGRERCGGLLIDCGSRCGVDCCCWCLPALSLLVTCSAHAWCDRGAHARMHGMHGFP